MESLGQQAAQHASEQILALATGLVDLVPVAAFIRGEFGCQPIIWSASTLAVFNK